MSDPWQIPFQILALVVLAGLLAGVVSLWWRHRGVHARIRHMLDALAVDGRDDAAAKVGLSADLHRLEAAFDRMAVRIDAQKATLDQAFEIAGLGTWAIRPDLDSVHASAHIRAVLGFPEDDDVVRIDTLRARILPEDRDAFDAALKRATEDQVSTELEFHAFDAAGEVRIFRARTGPDGAVPRAPERGISGIIQDITDLRQNELDMTRSSRLERLAGEVAHVGGWRYDPATRMFNGTEQTANIVGLDEDCCSLIDDTMDRLVTGDDRTRIERSFWTCVGTGTRFDEIAKFRKFGGGETWLRVIGEAERDASGTIVATHGAMQDVSELIRARTVANEVRTLLQTVLDDLSDGFIIHDRDGAIRYMNRRAHGILGIPDRDLVGGNIWQDLPPADQSPITSLIGDALETGRRQTFEGELSAPGQWVTVTVHPTKAGIAIYLDDITEERDARTRLRLLDAAMKRVADVVLITDAETLDEPGPRVVFANEAFVQMTGYSQDDILGASPRILQGPQTERDRLTKIRKAIETNQSFRTELLNYRKDGSTFIAEIDINPLLDADGRCTHYVSVQRDTTERRKTEEHLRAREEQFRLASQASRDIIWDWDMQTGIIWNSRGSEKILGFAPQSRARTDATGQRETGEDGNIAEIPEGRIETMLERIHPDDRLKVTESLDAALAGDAQTWRCDYRIRTQDDDWRHVADKAFIVRDDDGAPRRMVGAMTDVTEFRALDAQLHQAQKLETVGQLTGSIAHDFNNLITIILGNCDILLEDLGEDSPLRPLLRSIDDAAERAAGVSRDLLAFSRLQALELRPTDIGALIRRSSTLFAQAVDAGVDIRYDLSDAPAVALVDPNKLQAALLNLIINARAAIGEAGHIIVGTGVKTVEDAIPHGEIVPGDYVVIEVTDDGVGMSPEVAAQAFEPFFTTKEPGVGTGMGLSSVYGLVKQCRGHVAIVSEPGKGTTVTLGLPVADAVDPGPTEKSARQSDSGGGERILVVEDDAELRSFVCNVLSRKGYEIVEAENGASALNILKADDGFDLLFTDIVMPGGMNGVQIAEAARGIHPGLRVLFTTGYARDALPKERHVPSDVPMLSKPFRASELIESVWDILSREGPHGV